MAINNLVCGTPGNGFVGGAGGRRKEPARVTASVSLVQLLPVSWHGCGALGPAGVAENEQLEFVKGFCFVLSGKKFEHAKVDGPLVGPTRSRSRKPESEAAGMLRTGLFKGV